MAKSEAKWRGLNQMLKVGDKSDVNFWGTKADVESLGAKSDVESVGAKYDVESRKLNQMLKLRGLLNQMLKWRG